MASLPRVLPERRARQSRKTNWRYIVALAFCALLLGVGFYASPTRRSRCLSGDIELVLSDMEERLRMADSAEAVAAMQREMLRVAAGRAPRSDRVSHLFAELLRNIRGLGWAMPCVEREPPDGDAAHAAYAAANSSACGGGCFFAMTLEDATSFDALPNLVSQLLAALGRMGDGAHARRSFVSVYASGNQVCRQEAKWWGPMDIPFCRLRHYLGHYVSSHPWFNVVAGAVRTVSAGASRGTTCGECVSRDTHAGRAPGQDPRTPELLTLLRRVLDLLGVPNRVVARGSIRRPTPESKRTAAAAQDQHRLLLRTADARLAGSAGLRLVGDGGSAGVDEGLKSEEGYRAALRNAALEPLVAIGNPGRCDGSSSSGGGSGGSSSGSNGRAEGLPCPQLSATSPPPPARVSTLVFVSGGAFLCTADVLRLLRHSSADVACGVDLAKAPLPLLTPDEARAAMAGHAAAAWGLPRSWAATLSRSSLAYGAWARMYGHTDSYLPWSHLVLRGPSSVRWSRDAAGSRLRPLPPYAADAWTASRLDLGLLTPVYGCWAALVVARAQPFLGRQPPAAADSGGGEAAESAGAARRAVRAAGVDSGGGEADSGPRAAAGGAGTGADAGTGRLLAGVRRRRDPPQLRFRGLPSGDSAGAAGRQAGAQDQDKGQGRGGCVDTEPELLLCGDMHERGRHRWVVDPDVRLTYDWSAALELYGNFQLAGPENVRGLTFQSGELGVGDIHVSEEREEDELGGDYGSSISTGSSTADGGAAARLGGLSVGVGAAAGDYGQVVTSASAAQERRAAVRAERRWQQEWLPRVAAGAAAVECCATVGQEADASAARPSASGGSSCVLQDRSAAWRDWDAANGGGGGAAVANRSRKWRGSDLVGRGSDGGGEGESVSGASGGGKGEAVSAADAAADAALTALQS